MKLNYKSIYLLALLVVSGFCNITIAQTCGEIIQVTGKVDVLRAQMKDDERSAIQVTAPFKTMCSDVVVTRAGSRAKIKLANGIITMSPNSRLSIQNTAKKTDEPNMINLTFGKVRTFFKTKDADIKKDQQSRFRVRTPSAVVGVRGTDFYVSFDPNRDITTQATLEGQVQVEQLGTGQKAMVSGGQQVDVVKVEKADIEKIKEINKGLKTKKLENNEVGAQDGKEESAPTTKPALTVAEVVKPLQVVPIEKETIASIRQTSTLVKADDEFISKEAVKILGAPEKWIPLQDEIPGDLKDIKNVF